MALPSFRVQNVDVDVLRPEDEEAWKKLVGGNLGSDVERLYREETDLTVFEPAELERQTLQAAIEVFNSGDDKKGRKIFSQKRLETFDDLVKEVERAAAEWEAKTGRAISKKAMDLIGKLDNYKNILALFPSQSMLTSTFSAALKVLITAALDYSKTAEGLVPALIEITTAAGSVGDQHALFRTAEMRRYVVVFYSRILQFCSKAIQWYQSKRRKFFGTIKDNPYQDFKDMIDSIKEQAGLIRDVAIKGQQAEGRVIHEKLDLYGKALIREIEALKMQNWNNHLHQHYNIIVNVMPATGNKEIGRSISPGRRRVIKPTSRPRSANSTKQMYTRSELLDYAQKTFSLCSNPPAELRSCLKAAHSDVSIGREFAERLESWMAGASAVLLIRGEASANKISSLSSFAAQLIDSASFAGVKAVFYFCTFQSRKIEDLPVVTLIQALILQLVSQLSADLETSKDLSKQRFEKTCCSFDESWGLLEDLMELGMKGSTLVAIDCLECFEESLEAIRLVEKLLSLTTKGGNMNVKILLTTKRSTTGLFDSIPDAAIFRVGKPGSGNTGRRITRRYGRSRFATQGESGENEGGISGNQDGGTQWEDESEAEEGVEAESVLK